MHPHNGHESILKTGIKASQQASEHHSLLTTGIQASSQQACDNWYELIADAVP